MAKAKLEFRPMAESDLPILLEWLARPHLQQWWREEQNTLDTLRAKYLPRMHGSGEAKPFFVYEGEKPIGYLQYYCAHNGTAGWWPDEPGPGVFGIDQFLADEDRLSQGLGTKMVSQFVAKLFSDPKVTEVRVDPRPDNGRAIRCYAKVGFEDRGPISTPDGLAIMMVLMKAKFQSQH